MRQKRSIRSFDTLSLDTWAVVLSLGLALLIRFGVIKSVTW
jgi:hypothetical protein